ncbi:MAG: MgtC/SapB family protein [Bdellovibrionaceae bacterium]|nr:MgtC/SapB family protein [Pseudobdellovibrionaceae bacterium]
MQTELWQPYLISGAIGLLVGIEREKAHPSGKTMGVRTFVLIALLGAIAGGLQDIWMSLLIAIFCMALIAISYFNVTAKGTEPGHRGLITEFAAGIIFASA